MKVVDEAAEVAKHVLQMAELIALKPEGQRSITIRRKEAELLKDHAHHGTVDKLRTYCREHGITFKQVD